MDTIRVQKASEERLRRIKDTSEQYFSMLDNIAREITGIRDEYQRQLADTEAWYRQEIEAASMEKATLANQAPSTYGVKVNNAASQRHPSER